MVKLRAVLQAVKKALGIATNILKSYKEMAAYLGSKRYTADSLIEYRPRSLALGY